MDFFVAIIFCLFAAALLISYLSAVYESIRCVKIKNIEIRKSHVITGEDQLETSNHDNNSGQVRPSATDEILNFKQAPGPLPWPIIGNLNLLGQYEVPFEGFTELANKFGDVYSLTLGTTRCLVVNNLNLIREVLNQNGKHFGGRPNFIRFHRLFGGDRNNSLALCDWSVLQQKRRNLARKYCSPRNTSSFFEKMSEVGSFELQEFMERLANEIPLEGGSGNGGSKQVYLKPLIMRTCMNMFSQYMCSLRFDYDDTEFCTVVHYFDEIFWEINQGYAVDFLPWLLPFYSKHMNKLSSWSTYIRRFILKRIINAREEQNINLDEPERDFTDALLKSLTEDSSVTREALLFMLEDFLGGHSAIGNLVMLTLGYIALYPEIGKRVQQEVDTVTHKGIRSVQLADTERMPFTVATVYEVLRHSSSPIVPHVATEDVSIAGYGVTKGTMVIINNYKLNTSEEYWSNPNHFNPERFLETIPKNYVKSSNRSQSQYSNFNNNHMENIEDNHSSDVIVRIKKNIPHFLPFSIGKRTCIGQNLVKGFCFMMVASILQSYDVTCSQMDTIKMYKACVALPPKTFPVTLTKRIT